MQTVIRSKETNVDIRQTLINLYLEGKSRKEAMAACNLDPTWDNNRMSVLSSRLKLNWSWPLEKRQSGKKPVPQKPARKAKTATKRRDTKPARGGTSTTLISEPSAQAAQKAPGTEVEETRDTRRLRPSPGFISARERRLRGIGDSGLRPFGSREEDEAERYLNRHYAKEFG